MDDHFENFDPTTRFALQLREATQLREAAERLVGEGAAMFKEAHERTAGKRYSVVRVVDCARFNRRLDGIEGEWSQECARQMGVLHDPAKPFVPWNALVHQRVLLAGTASGLNLVAEPATPAVDALLAYSTVLRLGAQTFDGLAGNVLVPRVGTSAEASWPTETGTATSSDQVLDQVASTPKRVAGYTEFTKQLFAQAPRTVERMVANNLLGIVGAELDKALLYGTGTDQPVGIRNVSGITLTTGTAFDHAAAQAMLKNVAAANAIDERIRFLGAPATRELLALRGLNGTGAEAGYVWQDNMIASKPAVASGNVPSGHLYAGDFSHAWLLLWGAGIQLEINPYANFRADVVGMKVVCHADVAVVQPAAFHVSTGIT